MKLSELDKNFDYRGLSRSDLVWYDRSFKNFAFDGCGDLEHFHRIAAADLARLPEGISQGYPSTGIRLRFRSDANFIAVRAELGIQADMPIMARGGSHGFDLYEGRDGSAMKFIYLYKPMSEVYTDIADGYEVRDAEPGVMMDFELNFPLYNAVLDFALGVPEGARIELPRDFRVEKPVVFYGSSITQGAAASHPGNCYTTMLARNLSVPHTNLGFSGRAKGEPEMARYIGGLSMSAFVMDYDHNADTPAFLAATHEPFFKIVRNMQPELPILLISRPNTDFDPAEAAANFATVKRTYDNARAAGDRKVWLIDGHTLFGTDQRDACTVDLCHPTDLGFYRMYATVLPVLREMLGL